MSIEHFILSAQGSCFVTLTDLSALPCPEIMVTFILVGFGAGF
jgi:hypothetical protein